MKKYELIIGIVIGCILTFISVVLQSTLYERYDRQKIYNELSILTCKNLNSRSFLARNTIMTSTSAKFETRWDNYIENGLIPWNTDKILFEEFIEEKHPNLLTEFRSVDSCFCKLHTILIGIRKLQDAKTIYKIKERESLEKTASIINKKIEIKAIKIEKELLNFD